MKKKKYTGGFTDITEIVGIFIVLMLILCCWDIHCYIQYPYESMRDLDIKFQQNYFISKQFNSNTKLITDNIKSISSEGVNSIISFENKLTPTSLQLVKKITNLYSQNQLITKLDTLLNILENTKVISKANENIKEMNTIIKQIEGTLKISDDNAISLLPDNIISTHKKELTQLQISADELIEETEQLFTEYFNKNTEFATTSLLEYEHMNELNDVASDIASYGFNMITNQIPYRTFTKVLDKSNTNDMINEMNKIKFIHSQRYFKNVEDHHHKINVYLLSLQPKLERIMKKYNTLFNKIKLFNTNISKYGKSNISTSNTFEKKVNRAYNHLAFTQFIKSIQCRYKLVLTVSVILKFAKMCLSIKKQKTRRIKKYTLSRKYRTLKKQS